MSPEQARSVKSIDHRADLWSLGVVLYQALAGRTPLRAHLRPRRPHPRALRDLPPSVQQFAPWVPPEVAAITDRALRIEPGERFQSADEMLAAVRVLLPRGVEVHDDMLVPLDDATHDQVAPTYFRRAHTSSSGSRVLPTSQPPPEVVDSLAGTLMSPSGHPIPGNRPPSIPILEHAPALSAPFPSVATTGPGVVTPSNAPPKASRVPVVAVAVACCVAGGAAVYLFTRPPPPVPAAQPAPTLAVTAPPAPPVAHEAPAPSVSPVAPAAPSTSAAPPAATSAPTGSAEATAPTPSRGEPPHSRAPLSRWGAASGPKPRVRRADPARPPRRHHDADGKSGPGVGERRARGALGRGARG